MTGEKGTETLFLKDFTAQVSEVTDKLKIAFQVAETAANRIGEWGEGRQHYEEEQDKCHCVSEVMEDMVEMLNVVMHVMQTYGMMLINAANRVTEHGENSAVPEIKKKVEQVLTNLPDEIKKHLADTVDDDEKLN